MSLDLFPSNIDDAVNYAARVSAPEMPSTFSDNFNDAFNKGYLTSQSISGQIRKTTARGQLIDDAIAKTGDQSFGQLEQYGGFDQAGFNAKIAQHKAARPDLELQPISDEAIQAKADEIGVRQLSDSANLARRERTTGGTFGQFLGAAGAAFTDPVNLIAFPLAAPESLGILGTALAWGGIGAGSQTAIEALNATSMERIQPGYGASGQPVTNILEAGLGGAVLGGGLKGLASLWNRSKSGAWPRSVRDAGNVVESEAQIAGTNPLPGAEGEAAHRTAISKAIDDLANGRPVDVEGIVTPEMASHIDAYHGSPYDFAAFDLARVGTGEGHQAYGHGLYFSENVKVAQGYADALGPKRGGGVYDMDPNSPTFGEYQKPSEGLLYRVKITANKDRMLDLDVPLNQQAPEVQAAIKQAMGVDYHGNLDAAKAERLWNEHQYADGKTAVRNGFIAFSDEAVAKRLSDAGIPGLKYLDQHSRGADDGTRNFVVFDDKHVQITHKNGKPVNAEIRQNVVDQAAGLPPKQPELSLVPPEPAKPPGPNAEAVAALRDDLTPTKIEEALAGHDMPAEDAAKIAARIGQFNDPEKARAVLDEVFLRPQTIADTLPVVEKGSVGLQFEQDIPFADGTSARRFQIDGTDGQRAGVIDIQVKNDGKTLEIVHIGTEEGSSRKLDLGPSGVRSVLRQVRDLYPDAERLTGYRISGAHKGGTRDVAFDLPPRREVSQALDAELTPAGIEDARVHPDMQDTIARDLDKLMLEKPDMQVPTGVTVDAEGRTIPTTRKVEDVVAEADSRLAAAKEIEGCVGPYPAEAA